VASIFVKGKYNRPLSNLQKSSDWNNFWHKNTLLQNKKNGIVCIPIYRKNFFHHTFVNHPNLETRLQSLPIVDAFTVIVRLANPGVIVCHSDGGLGPDSRKILG